jgi:WD40 repeat protein
LVEPDLDWIVMKAIDKDRARRYETANGLSLDIQRFLASQPVEAAAPSVTYRMRKFVHRNRGAVAAGSVVAVSVLAGCFISVWQAVRATAANQSLKIERDAKATLADHNARLADENQARGEQVSATLSRTRVALAERQWHFGNVANARKLLDACPPHHRLWDWHTLRLLCTDTSLVFQSDVEFSRVGRLKVVLSPDGTTVAYADKKGILLRKADGTDAGLFLEGPPGMIEEIAFSPDGRRIACVANHGFSARIRMWKLDKAATPIDVAGTKQGANADAPSSGTGFHLRFSDDGRELVCAGSGAIHVWDLDANRLKTKFDHDTLDIQEVMLTPDGSAIVAGCAIQASAEEEMERVKGSKPATRSPARIAFLDRETGGILREIVLEETHLRGIAFSPDGKQAAFPASRDDVQLWNLDEGALVETLRGHQQGVNAIAFSADGRKLVTAGRDKAVKIWDLAGRSEIRSLTGHHSAITGVSFQAADGRIASISDEGEVRIWGPFGSGKQEGGERSHQGASEDGTRSYQFTFAHDYGLIDLSVWRTADPEASRITLAVPSETLPGRALDFQLSPDGAIAAVSLANIDMEAPDELATRIVLFDAATGKVLRSLRADLSDRPEIAMDPMTWALARTMPYGAMRFSPDSSSIAAACLVFASAWDVSTGRMVMRVELPDRSEAAAFAWHPDPATRGLACGSSNGGVFELKLNSPDIIRRFPETGTQAPAGPVNAERSLTLRICDLSYSPAGDRLASAAMDGRVLLWSCADGALEHDLTGHAGGVERVRFSKPLGLRLLTESADGTARFWDTGSGDEIVSLARRNLDGAILRQALDASAKVEAGPQARHLGMPSKNRESNPP